MSIRIASDGDAGVLATLRRAWSEENSGRPIDDPDFEAMFLEWWKAERETRTFFLVEIDDVAVGMANVKSYQRMPTAGRRAGCWGYVGNVFILAAQRNAGIGEALMRYVVAWARDQHLAHLRLAPSLLSRPFYARLGFLPGAVFELDPPHNDCPSAVP